MPMNVNVTFCGSVTTDLATQFQHVCNEIVHSDAQDVTVYITSDGGDVTAGLAIYNTLGLLERRIKTVNAGKCGSIAATIFLAGDRRVALPNANFSLHAASYIQGENAGKVSPNTPLIYQPFQAKLNWDEARITEFFGTPKERHISVDEAKQLGMVHEVTSPVLRQTDPGIVLDPSGKLPFRLDQFVSQLHGQMRGQTHGVSQS